MSPDYSDSGPIGVPASEPHAEKQHWPRPESAAWGNERYQVLIRSGASEQTACEQAARELLQRDLGGKWIDISGEKYQPLRDDPQEQLKHKDLRSALYNRNNGLMPGLGSYCIRATFTTHSHREEQDFQRTQSQVYSNFLVRLEEVRLALLPNPTLTSCMDSVRALGRGISGSLPVLGEIFEGSPLQTEIANLYGDVALLQQLYDRWSEIAKFTAAIENLSRKVTPISRASGMLAFLKSVFEVGYLTDEDFQTKTFGEKGNKAGMAAVYYEEAYGVDLLVGAMRGCMALFQKPHGSRFFDLLDQKEEGRSGVWLSILGFSTIGGLVYDTPRIAESACKIIDHIPGVAERSAVMMWMIDNPRFDELYRTLLRHDLTTTGTSCLLSACRENSDLIDVLKNEIAGSKLRSNLLAELADFGKDAITDGSLRNKAFEIGARVPEVARVVVRTWGRFLEEDNPNKATLLERATRAFKLGAREFGSFKEALLSADAPTVEALLERDLSATGFKRLSALLRTRADTSGYPPQSVTPSTRKIDPLEVNLGWLREQGEEELAKRLSEAARGDLTFRRGVRTIFETAGVGKSLPLLRAAAEEPGFSALREIANFSQLRRGFGRVLLEDPQRALELLSLPADENRWPSIRDSLLETNRSVEAEREGGAPVEKRNDVAFGQWRALKSVLVFGGEYSGQAAARIRNAAPGIEITVAEELATNSIKPLLRGKYDLFVCVTSWMRHDVEILAKNAQKATGAEWHWFNQTSPKLLAAELAHGFGVLMPDAGE